MAKSPQRIFEFGDVVKVVYHGHRPGVIVSASSHNVTAMDVVVMMITRKEQHAMRGGAIVLDRWDQYGLDDPSIAKPVFFSYPPEDLKKVGHVDDDIKLLIRESMAKVFGGTVKKK